MDLLAEGFDEVTPFAVHARVTAGEMWRDPFAALDAPALPPVLQP